MPEFTEVPEFPTNSVARCGGGWKYRQGGSARLHRPWQYCMQQTHNTHNTLEVKLVVNAGYEW